MDNQKLQQPDRLQVYNARLLLLADDGRMAQLLSTRLGDLEVNPIDKITDGILELSRRSYCTILLNTQTLENKTAAAVKSLRQIAPQSKIILYGDPFTELFTRKALRSGADDYLVWPIPPSELRPLLQPGHNLERSRQQIQEAGKLRLFEQYRELSQWAGQDKAMLVSQAEHLLSETLNLVWVKIRETADKQTTATEKDQPPDRTLPLTGPLGPIGDLELGPPRKDHQPPPAQLVNEAAMFIAALIHLAQRCEGLKHLATVDELTGTYNRRYLEFYLQQLIEQNEKRHTDMALLLFDIDDFKHYNDTYGHGAGDEILRQVSQLIRRCCREQDVVARIGGDEFAVLFWDVGSRREKYPHNDAHANETSLAPSVNHPETAFFLSNRFRRKLMTSEFPALGPEARGVLTVSGGLANFGKDAASADQLLAQADDALLAAKRSGKNRIYLVGQPHEQP